jgi:Glycosyl hydrolases family 43./Carbohydrate binding module (family 6).
LKGLEERFFLFERNGKYYLPIPHIENRIERLEYAMEDTPTGLFKMTGVIMDESPVNCWTNHQSFVEYKGQWYLFYHHNDYSPKFDKNRSIRVDSLSFNADGTIRKVTPTLRGVGVSLATNKIEIDRYSSKSESGSSIALLDSVQTFNGWKTILRDKNAWVQYNTVDFGKQKLKTVQVRILSEKGGTLEIHLDKVNGPVVAEIKVPKSADWNTVEAKLSIFQAGIHNLIVVLKDSPVEVDWLRFQ